MPTIDIGSPLMCEVRGYRYVILLSLCFIFISSGIYPQKYQYPYIYTVKQGDTIWAISQTFGVPIERIKFFNNLKNEKLYEGQKIKIPDIILINHKVKEKETLWSISRMYDVSVGSIIFLNNLSPQGKIFIGQTLLIPKKISFDNTTITHKVKKGESLYSIAKKYGIPDYRYILEYNGIEGNEIYVGMELKIPKISNYTDYSSVSYVNNKSASYVSYKKVNKGKVVAKSKGERGTRSSNYSILLQRFIAPIKSWEKIYPTYGGIEVESVDEEPVRAVGDGIVVFAKTLRGYGNTIIIQHPENIYSIYGYLKEINVKEGQNVSKGEIIAYLGISPFRPVPLLYFSLFTSNNSMHFSSKDLMKLFESSERFWAFNN